MAEDGTTVDPVESTEPAEPATPAGGEGNPTDPAPAATAQATDATEPTADMPSLLGEGDQNDGDQKPAQAAPEAYEPFDVEGQQFTEAQLEGFAATAKELGLSQDDLKAKSREWASLSEKDPVIGGANFKANVGVANSALKQFATPEFTALLRGSGLGAHPEVVRVFYRIGKAMQQDHGVTGSASAPAGARRRYPKSNMVVDE